MTIDDVYQLCSRLETSLSSLKNDLDSNQSSNDAQLKKIFNVAANIAADLRSDGYGLSRIHQKASAAAGGVQVLQSLDSKVEDVKSVLHTHSDVTSSSLSDIKSSLDHKTYGLRCIHHIAEGIKTGVDTITATANSISDSANVIGADVKDLGKSVSSTKALLVDHDRDVKGLLSTTQDVVKSHTSNVITAVSNKIDTSSNSVNSQLAVLNKLVVDQSAAIINEVKVKASDYTEAITKLKASLLALAQQVDLLAASCKSSYDTAVLARSEVEKSVTATTSSVSASLSALVDSVSSTGSTMTSITARVEQLRDVLSANIDTLLKQISTSLQHFSDIASDKTLQTISVGTEFINQCKVTIASLNQEARTLAFDYAKISEMKEILISHEDGVVRANRALSQSLIIIDDKLKQFNATLASAVSTLQGSEQKANGLAMVQVALNAISQVPSGLADLKRISQKEII